MMNKLIFSIILILIPVISGASEIRYRVDKSYYDVVAAIERIANEPRTVPFKVPNLPVMIQGKDVIVTTYARPATRYYRINVSLNSSIGKLHTFNKKLEIWGEPNSYFLKSSVDIGWGRTFKCNLINRIKNNIITNIEYQVLELEKSRVLYHASHMNQPYSVEEYSWYQIIMLVLDKTYRALSEDQPNEVDTK